MKANELPEKIYLEKVYPDNGVLPIGLNYQPSPSDIEYTRTDAFIEKACKFLANDANIPEWEGYNGTFGCDTSKLVKNFKAYMKGE